MMVGTNHTSNQIAMLSRRLRRNCTFGQDYEEQSTVLNTKLAEKGHNSQLINMHGEKYKKLDSVVPNNKSRRSQESHFHHQL